MSRIELNNNSRRARVSVSVSHLSAAPLRRRSLVQSMNGNVLHRRPLVAYQDTAPSTRNLPFPDWQLEYQAALLEVDPQKLPDRVLAAEAAIFLRQQAPQFLLFLFGQPNPRSLLHVPAISSDSLSNKYHSVLLFMWS